MSYYSDNRDRELARAKEYGKANNWKQKRDTNKVKARYAIRNELKRGRIIKAFCQFCSKTGNLEFHHADYSKPLDVLILCRECHLRIHREMAEVKS